jgi:hypothetical protein
MLQLNIDITEMIITAKNKSTLEQIFFLKVLVSVNYMKQMKSEILNTLAIM